jgi:hypothetical protein
MGRFDDFLKTRRSRDTAINYRKSVHKITDDPDAFLDLAEKNPTAAEKKMISHITQSKVSGAYLRMQYAAMKSFLTFYDVELKWKKISSVIPFARKVALDRAPKREEISQLLSVCDPRARMIVLCMASGGFRVGAWKWLNIGDVEFLDDGISKLTIYRGEPEQYSTFITPEATTAIRDYLEMRRRAGEEIKDDSPLVRDKWDFQDFKERPKSPELVTRLSTQSIASIVWRAWWRSGVRKKNQKKQEFKENHGFRKFYRSNVPACKEHGNIDPEVLMGHSLSYYKPSDEHLLAYYRGAIPALSIGEKYKLQEELKMQEKEHKDATIETRLELLELKERDKKHEEELDRLREEVLTTRKAWAEAFVKGSWREMKELEKEVEEHGGTLPPDDEEDDQGAD